MTPRCHVSLRMITTALAAVFALALPLGTAAAPAGPPVKVGSTLALTGPLAATALVHKITGEIYVEQLNRKDGLLGRPVEWVLLDDQSKPDVARSLYEKLITVDKVDLIMGPYATGPILAAMGVAQRFGKVIIQSSMGIPKLQTAIAAVRAGVEAVVILDGRQPHAMLAELFSESGSGTLISA